MKKLITIILAATLVSSCSYLPFVGKKDDKPAKTDEKKAEQKKVDISEEGRVPMAGDIKVIDGVEYIYTRNRQRTLDVQQEPENIWIRKDQYSPGLFESMLATAAAPSKKEKTAMEARIAKLEEELKKKGIAPQMAYPVQMSAFPGGAGYMAGSPMIAFDYPSPRMKRRVVVLPAEDQTNYKNEHLGELTTKRIVSKLESTGTIICVDPSTTNITGSLTDPANMKILNEVFGVQAVLVSTLSDVYTSTSKIEGKEQNEASFAMAKIAISVLNTDTGAVYKQMSGRNPVFLSREKGDFSTEKAKIRAIDLTMELVAEDLLKAILYLDWHARIASIEEGKVYINAGRLSGLEKGRVLEVYSPGEKVMDTKTGLSLGTKKGAFKGELEVVELFGVDASWTKTRKGTGFSPTDLVYVKQ